MRNVRLWAACVVDVSEAFDLQQSGKCENKMMNKICKPGNVHERVLLCVLFCCKNRLEIHAHIIYYCYDTTKDLQVIRKVWHIYGKMVWEWKWKEDDDCEDGDDDDDDDDEEDEKTTNNTHTQTHKQTKRTTKNVDVFTFHG